jgi:hypothetical protein
MFGISPEYDDVGYWLGAAILNYIVLKEFFHHGFGSDGSWGALILACVFAIVFWMVTLPKAIENVMELLK